MDKILATNENWLSIKVAVENLQEIQLIDGSVPLEHHEKAHLLVRVLSAKIEGFISSFPHDTKYLRANVEDFRNWAALGFGVPDFHDSLVAFHPEDNRVNGIPHIVIFPMYTQNGTTTKFIEAVLCETVWPEFVAKLEETYTNPMFVPMCFLDFTAGYDSNSAVLFPETVSMRTIPKFTWGTIFADREAARFCVVVKEAIKITKLDLPSKMESLLEDQELAMNTFVMWDLIHDRTHMRGDLPFDPFMIKQRMPFFLYSLEELRCDLTAFREAVRVEKELLALSNRTKVEETIIEHASMVQYAVLFDRIFRFPLTGSRIRNYDGLGGQLLFAHLHQRNVIQWHDVQLSIDWEQLTTAVIELGDAINLLYWASIDRPKHVHWLAAYELVASRLAPHPASKWITKDFPLGGSDKEWTNAVLDDEFPLSMFYEALSRKMGLTIASTRGIRA